MHKPGGNRIHLCYLISSLANEGPTRVLLNIIRRIDSSVFRVSVITLVPEKKNSLLEDFLTLEVSVVLHSELCSDGERSSFHRRVRGIRQYLKRENVDIIHGHCPRSLMYLMFLRSDARTAYTAHIYPGVQTLALYGPLKGRLVAALCNTLIRFVAKPIACSDSVSLEFLQNSGLEIEAVNNGIDQAYHSKSTAQRAKYRAQLGLKEEVKYFLFVGRLSSEKRPVELAELFNRSTTQGVALIIIGDGPEVEKLETLSGERVRLDGFIRNIEPYLHACDYYISSSKTEGLANSLLEAMAAGMPCVLSDIPSHRAVVSRADTYLGELFDPVSQADFEATVRTVLKVDQDLHRPMIEEEFRRRYTSQVMAQGYTRIYEGMVS